MRKNYKIQNIETGLYLNRGSNKSWTTKGTIWQSYPSDAVEYCVDRKIPIKVISFELKEIDYKIIN